MNLLFKPIATGIPSEIDLAFDLLKQLRPQLARDAFDRLTQTESRYQGGYRLLGAWDHDSQELLALAGVRTLIDFVHGEHWYIDDLVTREGHRCQGIGAQILKWVETEAFSQGIRCVRLSTGASHESGKRFYEREGWELLAVTYKKFRTPG